MKAFLFFILAFAGTCLAVGQGTLPSSGPSYAARDTSDTDILPEASIQAYSDGVDRENIAHVEPSSGQSIDKQAIVDSGPIRDWSNPPGFLGYSKSDVAISKRKPLSSKKYHRPKSNRCYSF